jgi:DNA-binding MarR family transcriptional regulator
VTGAAYHALAGGPPHDLRELHRVPKQPLRPRRFRAARDIAREIRQIQRDFPEIYFACQVSHGRRRLAAGALTPQDAVYLGHLDRRRPVSPRRLASHLGIAPSTLSAFIKRMQSFGYLERVPSTRSAREAELRLTAGGELAIGTASILDAERLHMVLGRLDAPSRRTAVRGLALLAQAARAAREQHAAAERVALQLPGRRSGTRSVC